MMARFLLCLLILGLLGAPNWGRAQDLASLIADRIEVDPAGRIVAEGNVSVFYAGRTLEAGRISYTRTGDLLEIGGPIIVRESDGTVFSADAATLDRSLANGVMTSARLVLDRQLQLAAAEISRVGGRYTTLSRTVASSCRVCKDDPTPLWDIRAERVIHDALERQIYFENAQLRVVGVPVFYLPRLRLPDPTLERTSGFLIPRLRTSSDLGTGLKVPYFIAIGDHADLTLTPYVSSITSTVELRFRQEIRNGRITADGALTKDTIEGDRGYLFAELEYFLPRDFVLSAGLELVSDPGYLFTYDYSDLDRLTNEVAVTRVRDKDAFRASITEFRTLRENEIPIRDTLPDRFIEIGYRRDLPELSFGGRTMLELGFAALNRPSSADVDGRDTSRIGAGLSWSDTWIGANGLVARGELGLRADAYNVGQDPNFPTNQTRIIPRAAAELRWPLARTNADGSRDVLEPILRLDLSDTSGAGVPLEDSRVVEFDEANLFAFSRYPGIDGSEDGLRAAVGATWQRGSPEGWSVDLAFGRVASLDGSLGYADGSGLAGDQSEWLVAGRFAVADGLSLGARALLDDSAAVTLAETRLDWVAESWSVQSSYVYAQPEPAENRTDQLSEWSLEGRVQLGDNWTASTDWRYDFEAGRAARAGLGLDYVNECLRVDLSLSRRFATSTSLTPTTDFGFRVSLLGVGNGSGAASGSRTCKG